MTCYYYMIVHDDETMGASCKRYLDLKYRFKGPNGMEYIKNTVHEYEEFDDCKYADGVGTDIMVINGQFPAQSIEVCYGDTIVADVINRYYLKHIRRNIKNRIY